MRGKIRDFLRIPPEILPAFRQDTLQKNRLSLLVIAAMIFGMEAYNIARVLFMSRSGLGTLNNRIYFGMYCALLLAAVVYLVVSRCTRGAKTVSRLRIQYVCVAFAFLWHICLNAYDLMRDPDGEVSIYMTAMLGLAVFIQMPAPLSVACHVGGYAVFALLAGRYLESGPMLNLTFSSIVALAVSLTKAHSAAVVLLQRREIGQINARLQALLEKDPLTGLLNKSAFEKKAATRLRAASGAEGLTMMMVDLDDFKGINDRLGHPCGDYVLQQTAQRLQSAFPTAAEIGRIGGDEFALAGPAGGALPPLHAPARRYLLAGERGRGAVQRRPLPRRRSGPFLRARLPRGGPRPVQRQARWQGRLRRLRSALKNDTRGIYAHHSTL